MKIQMKQSKKKNEPDLKLTDGQNNKKSSKKNSNNNETKKFKNY